MQELFHTDQMLPNQMLLRGSVLLRHPCLRGKARLLYIKTLIGFSISKKRRANVQLHNLRSAYAITVGDFALHHEKRSYSPGHQA